MQQTMGLTPKTSLPTKRKRTDSDIHMKTANVEKELTSSQRLQKEPASRYTTPRVKQEYNQPSPPSTPSRSCFEQKYNSALSKRSQYSPSTRVKIDPYANIGGNQDTRLSGIYEVNCPVVSDTFNDYNLVLTLAVGSRNFRWAKFCWGPWDGIIQMNPGPSYNSTGQPCSLGWCLRDLETGQLKFVKKCMGEMTFFEDGTFLGSLYEMPGTGTVEVEGTRLAGPNLEDDFQYE
jgi:hypothetical protein